jgi:hypothetical protein
MLRGSEQTEPSPLTQIGDNSENRTQASQLDVIAARNGLLTRVMIALTDDVRRVSCRQIEVNDIPAIVRLLAKGFRPRSRQDWLCAFRRLLEHPTPSGFPKFGYLLQNGNCLVGVILLIYSSIALNGKPHIRCNVCSWYVEPPFRAYAGILAGRALRHKHITYIDITAAPQTAPILETQGYVQYCSGWLVCVPALSQCSDEVSISRVTADGPVAEELAASEVELLKAHVNYGCISLTCSSGGRAYPFVFMPRRKFGLLPFVYLIYCRDLENFARFAAPLGRFLSRRGFPFVLLPSNGRIPGLAGIFIGEHPKYFRGPEKPRLGDFAYSELAMFPITGERFYRWSSVPVRDT